MPTARWIRRKYDAAVARWSWIAPRCRHSSSLPPSIRSRRTSHVSTGCCVLSTNGATPEAVGSQRFLEPDATHPHTDDMSGKNITVTGVPAIGGSPFAESAQNSLTNHLLIAMPSLSDPNFAQTVALICEHTERGALGIVLNKPLPMRL